MNSFVIRSSVAHFAQSPALVLWHLDHGLRPDSPEDSTFVEQFAKQLGVRCIAERAELAEEIKQFGGNIEAAGTRGTLLTAERSGFRHMDQPCRAPHCAARSRDNGASPWGSG
jgi:hypothetical protein